jgi:rhamnosyl/mannosyltransferase
MRQPGDIPARILHVGKFFSPHPGGIESYLRDLVSEQVKRGLQVTALVHATEQGFRSTLERYSVGDDSVTVARAARWFTLAFAPISPTFPLLIERCIREADPQLLHLHLPNPSAFFCLFLPAARRIPWVIHWHADVLASQHSLALRWLYRLYRPFETACLKRASRIVVTSLPYLETSEPLREFEGKCVVVPLGVHDLEYRTGARDEYDSSRLHVVFVGRLAYYKGLRYLLEATEALPYVQVSIVGSGRQEQSLRKWIAESSARDRIKMFGALSDADVIELVAQSDCLCLPSVERTEAFGMVLLEAMRLGRPCIATTVIGSGMNWVLEDGLSGLLVEPESSQALGEALSRLHTDRVLLAAMGRAARERYEDLFRSDRSERGIREVYADVLSGDSITHTST